LLLPPIFAVTVAYIGDEWPAARVAGVAGIYIAGSSLGGFCGRFLPGLLSDLFGWRPAFLALAGLSLAGALMVVLLLPKEKGFIRSPGLFASAQQMLRHLKNPQLLATYGIGFGVLFNFIAVFTYVSFHLAAPPYRFSSTLLGLIFVTYLAGTARTPSLRACGHCRVGGRRAAHAAPTNSGDYCRAYVLRRMRHAVPDDRDGLRHGNRQGRPLVGRRSLRDVVLRRRQHGRLSARPGLGMGRMAGDRRHGDGHAGNDGRHCGVRLSKRQDLGSNVQAKGGSE
jgi:hypothetical protein